MWKAGQWKVGQGHWNMCMTKEAVMGLQPGVVEGWVMGPIGIVSIGPKMATRGHRCRFGHSGTTYSVSKCSKSLPRVSSSCSSISDQNSNWIKSYGNFTEMCYDMQDN